MQHQTMPAKTTAMQGPLPAGRACNMQSQRPPPIIMHASDEACHPCCRQDCPRHMPMPPLSLPGKLWQQDISPGNKGRQSSVCPVGAPMAQFPVRLHPAALCGS